ncbi:MAG: PH domain-containing protein [Theionarchaea archaeon]|nr:PH domain-containing protein [Theionarchaea archaeon]
MRWDIPPSKIPERHPANTRPRDSNSHIMEAFREKYVLMFLVILLVTIGMVGLALEEGGLKYWLLVALLILCLVYCIVHMVGSSYLVVDSDGITVRTPFSSKLYEWIDIEGFEIGLDLNDGISERVYIRLTDPYRGQLEVPLPDSYGVGAKKLADFLRKRREHFTTRSKYKQGFL